MKWGVCRKRNSLSLPMYCACRTIDGVMEMDEHIFGTERAAQERADELNAQEKAPDAAATAQGAEE